MNLDHFKRFELVEVYDKHYEQTGQTQGSYNNLDRVLLSLVDFPLDRLAINFHLQIDVNVNVLYEVLDYVLFEGHDVVYDDLNILIVKILLHERKYILVLFNYLQVHFVQEELRNYHRYKDRKEQNQNVVFRGFYSLELLVLE